jgi:16S rRNA (adenine1518-N6/adenine1519-N6)-dimethyltransferase
LGRPKKRFSQNFLLDKNIAAKIVSLLDIKDGETVFEIGPGQGILTEILAAMDITLLSFELDNELSETLQTRFESHPNVTIINQDFLKVVPEEYHDGSFKLIGNIPYDITSPLIDWLITYRERIPRAVITTQKELAERIASGPGSKNWAPISIFCRSYFDVTNAFSIPPQVFFPQPRVYSCTLRFDYHPRYDTLNNELFEKVVRHAFRHRRKQLINNLTEPFNLNKDRLENAMAAVGLKKNIRAEQVTIEQFLKLTDAMAQLINP